MGAWEQNNVRAARTLRALPPEEIVFGRSAVMMPIRQTVRKILGTEVPILIHGANGTGKGLLAHFIHSQSASSSGPFVKVNCAAIPAALLESELFGYERGAFTGAYTSKPGRVELAQNGTLFLDQIADSDGSLQSKLLHFLQDGRFSRIGDHVERSVHTRVICSTSKDLAQEIDAGRFRSDLFYRISVVQLHLPRLRERREDIPLIAEYLRTSYEKQFSKPSKPLGTEMLDYLQGLSWPGNVRELANSIARYVLVGPEAILGQRQPATRSSRCLRAAVAGEQVPFKGIASEAIKALEKRVILEALQANQWNRRKTAQALQISYRSLIYKIRSAGLPSRRSVSNMSGLSASPTEPCPPAD